MPQTLFELTNTWSCSTTGSRPQSTPSNPRVGGIADSTAGHFRLPTSGHIGPESPLDLGSPLAKKSGKPRISDSFLIVLTSDQIGSRIDLPNKVGSGRGRLMRSFEYERIKTPKCWMRSFSATELLFVVNLRHQELVGHYSSGSARSQVL
jgi:hypothetical protein